MHSHDCDEHGLSAGHSHDCEEHPYGLSALHSHLLMINITFVLYTPISCDVYAAPLSTSSFDASDLGVILAAAHSTTNFCNLGIVLGEGYVMLCCDCGRVGHVMALLVVES